MSENKVSINERLNRHVRWLALSRTMIWAGVALMIICILLIFFADALLSILAVLALFFFTLPYVIVCIILRFVSISVTNKLQQQLVDEVIPNLVHEVLGADVTYERDGRIPDEMVVDTAMIPNEDMDSISGNDLIVGKYKGMDYALSDIRILSIRTHTDSDGNTSTQTTEMFKGQWMILKTNLRPSGKVSVRERSVREAFQFANPVATESVAFNERFEVAGDPLDVFKLITPPMMEKLLAANEADKGAITCLRYLPDGIVGISLETGVDSMDIEKRHFKNEEEMLEAMRKELSRIFAVVDALELEGAE